MSNAFSVLRVFALILLMFGTTMLLPLSASWIFNDGAQSAYDEWRSQPLKFTKPRQLPIV